MVYHGSIHSRTVIPSIYGSAEKVIIIIFDEYYLDVHSIVCERTLQDEEGAD